MKFQHQASASYGLALALFATWCISAVYLEQPLLATQRSSNLLQLGAVDGNLFATHEWWRLIVSQFLHVYFLHMVFNAICVAVVGIAVEKAFGLHGLLIVYVVGGTAGQSASVAASPALVSSGASQALMALCAAALCVAGSRVRLVALLILIVQATLDFYASGAIKMGHSVGFGAGLLLALVLLFVSRSRISHP